MLRKLSQIAAKVETTLGAAIALSATDSVFIVYDAEIVPDAEFMERPATASSSRLAGVIGARAGTATFTVEAMGKGSSGSPDWASVFLSACGFYDSSNTWKLVTGVPALAGNTSNTITIAKYTDGRKLMLSGCQGNAVFRFVSGEPLKIDFTFRGKYSSMTDVALLVPTLPTIIAPRVANATITIATVAIRTGEITIDLGNNVILRPDIGTGAGVSGYAYATIVDRDIRIRMNQEAALVATRDDYGKWLAGTLQAMVLDVGGATWNEMDFRLPKVQWATIADADQDGMLVDAIEGQAIRDSVNDDEMTIAFVAG